MKVIRVELLSTCLEVPGPIHPWEISQRHIIQQIHAAYINAVRGLRDGLVVDILEESGTGREIPHLAAIAPVAVREGRGRGTVRAVAAVGGSRSLAVGGARVKRALV